MKKTLLNEVKQLQKIAGILKENESLLTNERDRGDLSDYVVQGDDGSFYVDQEDPDTGEAIAIPGDSLVFIHNGQKYEAIVTRKDFGRNGVYLLRLTGDFDDDDI